LVISIRLALLSGDFPNESNKVKRRTLVPAPIFWMAKGMVKASSNELAGNAELLRVLELLVEPDLRDFFLRDFLLLDAFFAVPTLAPAPFPPPSSAVLSLALSLFANSCSF
jgi:hypothetical protein